MANQSMTQAVPAMAGVAEMVLGLLLVVGLILAVAWAMRRVVPGAGGAHSVIRVLATLPVGPRERLVLVDAAGRQLLLGVTAQQITSIHAFEGTAVDVTAGGGGEFAARLREMLAPAVRR